MIPENELGVIVEFAKATIPGVIETVSIRAAFPDAIVKFGTNEYRAEFEYQASNFETHRHDVRECDIIICWTNDWPECILPVIELSNPEWIDMPINLTDEQIKEIAYWKQRAKLAESRLRAQDRNDGENKNSDKLINTYAEYVEFQNNRNGNGILPVKQFMAHTGRPQRTVYNWYKKYKNEKVTE